jgi:hypothetical protein
LETIGARGLRMHVARERKGTMTLKEALQDAIQRRDALQAGRVVSQLRDHGYTYKRCFALAKRIAPWLEPSDWEDLMYEADELEAAE